MTDTEGALSDQNRVLEVRRASFGDAELHDTAAAELQPGEIRLRIDEFALTANNISYAGAGDLLGYWDFFPAEHDRAVWGRVPAMGWAEIVESANPDLPAGGRYYGWFPMADSVTFTATATRDGFRDDGAHRQAHAPVYRAYVASDRDPYSDAAPDGEDRHAVLRVLFLTGFLADEFFADCGGAGGDAYFGAEQVIVLSASSKTAIGFAQRAAKRAGLSVIGLTSASNVAFVESLGFYDIVVSYDDIAQLPGGPSVIIDMAGNPSVLADVHAHLGDDVRHSMMVGRSHHDSPPASTDLTGPAPQFFFAPMDIERQLAAWGPDEYRRRSAEAMLEFIDGSRSWLEIEHRRGPDGVVSAWADVYNGSVAPNVGLIASFASA